MFIAACPKLYTLMALLALTTPALNACATPVEATPTVQVEENALQLNYKAGQAISLITVETKEGDAAKAAVSNYYKTAFPLASKYGLRRDGQLMVKAVPSGAHKPFGLVFYSYPDAASEAGLNADPEWPVIKATRPEAWDELRVYTQVLDQDLSLTFSPSKTYTLAVAWTNPDHPNDYAKYMDGIQEAVAASGGRFLHKIYNPSFESHARPSNPPGQVTLVEWDNASGLANFQNTEGFKQNLKYLQSGVTDFELMILGTS